MKHLSINEGAFDFQSDKGNEMTSKKKHERQIKVRLPRTIDPKVVIS
jgi:hypothetical protein